MRRVLLLAVVVLAVGASGTQAAAPKLPVPTGEQAVQAYLQEEVEAHEAEAAEVSRCIRKSRLWIHCEVAEYGTSLEGLGAGYGDLWFPIDVRRRDGDLVLTSPLFDGILARY